MNPVETVRPVAAAENVLVDLELEPAERGRLVERLWGALGRPDRRFTVGTLWAFATNAAGMAFGFGSQVLLARVFGTKGYGLYLYVLGWANIASLLCTLEFSGAAVRFVSEYAARNEWALFRGFLRRSKQIVGGTATVIAALGLVATLVAPGLSSQQRTCLAIACALFPILSMLQLLSSALQGLQRVLDAQVPFQVLRPILFALGVLFLVAVAGSSVGIPGVLVIQALATGVALLLSAGLLRRATPIQAWAAFPEYRTREWLLTAVHFIGISVAQMILSAQADVLIIGTLRSTSEAGLYGAASQFTTLVGFGASALMFMVQPRIADLHARRDRRGLQRLVHQSTTIGLLASAPVLVLLLAFGRPLLSVYGGQFTVAYPVLVVLGIAQVVMASTGMLVGYLLTMTGNQREAARIIGGSAALNLLLTLILTPQFGIIGAAVATAIAATARTVVLTSLSARRLQLDFLRPWRSR